MIRNVLRPLGFTRAALAVVVGLPVFIISNAFAQAPAQTTTGSNIPATSAPAGGQAEVERVIVTGSNIPTAEEVGPNPVDTYRRDDITRLGVRSSTDLIQKVPAITGSTVNENNTNGGDGSVRIDLRGIDPKETLVLQDGRRIANVGFASSSPDFNMFPLGLIDHIDILKDGASPNYGADAVAGVVNVYLIHRFRGLELYASYGNSNAGFANDMGEETAYLLAGTGDDKTNIVVYAGFYNRAAVFSRDVDISHYNDFRPFGGSDVRSGNYAGRVQGSVYQPGLNGGSKNPSAHAFANVQSDTQYVGLGTLTPNNQLFNFGAFTPEIAAVDRQYFYGSMTRDLCDKYLTAFADFKYVRTFFDGALAGAPFTPDVWTDATHAFGISAAGISVPIQNAFNPFTVPNYTSAGGFDPKFPNTAISAPIPGQAFTTGVRYRGLEAGLRTDKITTDNYVFTGGLNGNLGEFGDYMKTWNWELGFRYSDDHRIERFGGIVNNNALRNALLDTNPATAFNPFGINQNNKGVIDQVFVTTNHLGDTTEMLEDFKINGDMFNTPWGAGPVSFAVGSEHRTEHTSDNPDALTASGQTTGATNFAPTKGSRDVWSIWWEVRVPITSPTWNVPGFYSLEVDYAERFEDFSDFGSTEKPKFSVRWQPIDTAWTLRASYIEAFHAPALGELFSGVSQSFPNVNDPQSGKKTADNPSGLPTGTEPQVEQDLSGNPNLQPETAYEYSWGTVVTPGKWWAPLTGITASIDYIHIDLHSYVNVLDPQFVIDHEGGTAPSVVIRGAPLGPGQAGFSPTLGPILTVITPFQNLGRFIEDAYDYEFVWEFATSRLGHGDWGTTTLTFNGTYISSIKVQEVPGGKTEQAVGKFGGGFQGPNGGGSFTHNRWYSSLFYDGPEGSCLAGLDTGVTVHYVGQYWDTKGFETTHDGHQEDNRKVREWITLDWLAQYTFNMPAPAAAADVAGYSKDGGKNVKMDGKDKNVMPVSTAEYNPCGWRAWLDKTTLIVGVENVFDEEPPFVAAAFENGFDEQTTNAKGRFWYVAVKKRF
jgi:iron complex outermembrane receptor protein